MLGVLVNALAILAGGSVGLLAKKGIPEKITNAIMTAIALCVIYIGVSGMLKGEITLVLIVSMVLGTAVGTLLDLDGRIERRGGRIERRFQRGGKRTPFAEGFVTASLLFCVGAMAILGSFTAEGSGQSHAAIIARSLNIPGITQVGEEFLKDCDGREVILNATEGECILDPDAAARQSAITCICEMQRQNEELNAQLELPNRTRDGEEFELLANCFGPEDVGTAMESGASGVGLLRSSYMMMPGHAMDEQEQYLFYTSCLAAARGRMVTVRTFDFGADRTMADAYQGVQSSKLGLRGIRSSLRNLPQMAVQICALMRAAAKGPLRVMLPMVTNIEDWDSAMQVVDHCRRKLAERGVEFEPAVTFGVMLSVQSA